MSAEILDAIGHGFYKLGAKGSLQHTRQTDASDAALCHRLQLVVGDGGVDHDNAPQAIGRGCYALQGGAIVGPMRAAMDDDTAIEAQRIEEPQISLDGTVGRRVSPAFRVGNCDAGPNTWAWVSHELGGGLTVGVLMS